MIDFDTFYEQQKDRVRMRICSMLYYQPDLIDDVTQDTWIKIWRYLPTLQHDKSLASWVWLIATNCVRDTMRYQKTRAFQQNSLESIMERAEIDEDKLTFTALQEPDPYTYIPERLEAQELRQAVWDKTLPWEKRALQACAENMPVTKQRLSTARRNFRDKYDRAEARAEARLEKDKIAKARTHPRRIPGVLTDIEREVLRLRAQGYRNKAIAKKLYLQPQTVKNIASRAYKVLSMCQEEATSNEVPARFL